MNIYPSCIKFDTRLLSIKLPQNRCELPWNSMRANYSHRHASFSKCVLQNQRALDVIRFLSAYVYDLALILIAQIIES